MTMPAVDPDPIAELLITYNELNSSRIEELTEEPSPLEFMRYAGRNTPFVIRGGAADWKAATWDAHFLEEFLRDETVNVAVTPEGNADSPTRADDGQLVFAKPWYEDQPFPEFLRHVIAQEKQDIDAPDAHEVRYAQTQNDNLRHEYASLFSHVQRDIPFARIALQRAPEAINLWIGNSRSVTALHRDNYENIYVQILGKKHFVLLPPHCQPCVVETDLRPAGYVRRENGQLDLVLEEGDHVPFATWDPDNPSKGGSKHATLVEPVRVTLNPGDILYLPAMWYHKVSQSCGEDGICVGVNYWYDMDFTGPLYPMSTFVRSVFKQHITK